MLYFCCLGPTLLSFLEFIYGNRGVAVLFTLGVSELFSCVLWTISFISMGFMVSKRFSYIAVQYW